MAAEGTRPRRILLGTTSSLAGRQRVFRIPDGIEVHDIESFQVTCRRVFFDEVVLVTHHRTVGWPFLLGTGAAAVFFAFWALIAGLAGGVGAALGVYAVTGLPALVAFVLRLALGVDVVTVHGKRSQARIQFWLRRRRARELFRQICRLVQDRQDRERPPA